ncbi:Chloroplast SRP43 Subunit of Signal Recognition particle [Klebsormidium nitens]|uniref:Chloroplast SRP43 Subunit of Signal Recognition particle n=1 Tax=Klebsormidium nitens TaxID=105231 RepID=A0A1Y1IIA2_KLENI|nr:Chloroplast SRP43 Subunit of Signal Recognition particle [Klebsormidium nitens]|eukprot:GAQ90615.1 Chloroplast SRP43 Subunit of Signal Recognition particle [Klebsormidium nitens]
MAGVLAAKLNASGWAKCSPSRELERGTFGQARSNSGSLAAVQCNMSGAQKRCCQALSFQRKRFEACRHGILPMGWRREKGVGAQSGSKQKRAVIVCVQAEETEGTSRDLAEDFGEVEKILASRVFDGQTQFLITWKDGHEDTWEPPENLAEDVKAAYTEPWWKAARKGDVKALTEFLQDEGRDVNAVDENRRTALHFVAGLGNEEALQLLMEAGAEVEPSDKEGFTPLHIAAGYMHINIVKLLLEFGADPEAADKNGRTVLDLVTELLERTPKMNPMMFERRIALDQIVNMLDDAVYEDVSVEQILDKRTVEGGTAGAMTEYLVRWSDGTEDTWEPATNIADDLIQDFEAGLEYGVAEQILEKRRRKKRTEYLVKWQDSEEPSWEPARNLDQELVKAFEATHPKENENAESNVESSNGAAQSAVAS